MASLFAIPRPRTESLESVDGVSPLLRPISLDLIIVVYVLSTVTLVLAFADRIPHAERVVMSHLGGLLVYALLRWAATSGRLFRFLFLCSLIGLVIGIFEGIGSILPHLHAADIKAMKADSVLSQLDQRVFGGDPTKWFGPVLTPFTVTVLQICYTSYFFLSLVVMVVIVRKKGFQSLLSWLAVIIGCFFTTYIGYYLVPAYGPRVFNTYAEPLPHTGLSAGISAAIDSLDMIRLNAFPSGHVAVTLVYLAILFYESKRIAWICLPLVVGLVVATVALRYHYLIDIVAGVLVAALWIPWGARAVFSFDHRPRRNS